jgi:hypothetical protein
MQLMEVTRVSDVVAFVETTMGWVYDPPSKRFIRAAATHTVDEPDAFGRPTNTDQRASLERRGLVAMQFRFVKLTLGTQGRADLGAGFEFDRYSVSGPEGVQRPWINDTEQRGYFQGTTQGLSTISVATTRETIEAGVQLTGMASRLPGNGFRLDGDLSISSFTDTGLDKAQVEVPLQIDGERGKWYRVFVGEGANASVGLALRRFRVDLSAAGSAVAVEVRVD